MSVGNRLIDTLPLEAQRAVIPRLARVAAARGKFTVRAGEPIAHVHFPVNAVMAIVVESAEGGTVEVGSIGREGMVETDAPLEAAIARRSAVCRVGGTLLRIPAGDFRALLRTEPSFLRMVRSTTLAQMSAAQQLVFCNVQHTIEQRLARWLLGLHDRSQRERLRVTQAEIAAALGVRRAGVSVAIARLRVTGAVASEHGGIIVLDRERLAAASCECYAIMRSFAA